MCVPGFNCYSCPGAVGACPLGSLQNALAYSDVRAPYYVLGMLMLFGLIFGRVICGFLCPVGLIQELIYKIKTPKLRKSRYTRALSYFKYVMLAVFVICIPIMVFTAQGVPLPAFCKYICPAGTLEGAIGLLSNSVNSAWYVMLGLLFTRKFIIMILIALACVFIFRAFCRFLCPLGAIYGLFARVALLGVKVDDEKCTDCGLCVNKCKLDIRRVGDHECVQCGQCVGECPTRAITWKRARVNKRSNAAETPNTPNAKRRRLIAWATALIILAGALWYFNRPDDAQSLGAPIATPPEATLINDVPAGKEVGLRCPDFSVPMYPDDAVMFTLESARGKIVVINFWATWCGPCVSELPYFQTIYEKYPDDVALIAIHSDLVTDDVQAFIDNGGYTLPFALDADGSVITALGGSVILPMTVVLDRNGVIVYNSVGSINYNQLEALIQPLL